MTYRIYGRKEYTQPLEQVGRLVVEQSEALRDKALQELGAVAWVELVALPERAVIPVISRRKQGDKE